MPAGKSHFPKKQQNQGQAKGPQSSSSATQCIESHADFQELVLGSRVHAGVPQGHPELVVVLTMVKELL